MSKLKDSTQVKTIIPYPKKGKVADTSFVAVTQQRKGLEAKPLQTVSYNNILLSATLLSSCLLLLMHLYVKRESSKNSLLSYYFSVGKREKGQIHVKSLHLLQHVLSFIVITSLGYYLLIHKTLFQDLQTLLYVVTGFTLFIFVRLFLILLTNYLANGATLAAGHLGVVRFINKLLGFLLLPFLLLALFSPEKSYVLIINTILFLLTAKLAAQLVFVYRLLKRSKFSIFHSFLYLCTLEVLPIIYAVMFVGFLMST